MSKNFNETKAHILAAVKKINEFKPINFNDAMIKLNAELSIDEDFSITNFSSEVMAIKLCNEDVAYVGGLVITGQETFTLFDDESEIIFCEDAEVFRKVMPENYYEEQLELCKCECHTKPGIKHVIPCCITCEYCGKHIRYYYKHHTLNCPSNPKNKTK